MQPPHSNQIRKIFDIKNILILVIALVPSLGYIQTKTVYNVSSCYYFPGCDMNSTPKGTLTSWDYGYPVTYMTHLRFENTDGALMYSDGITLDGVLGTINRLYEITIKTLLWFAFIYIIVKLIADQIYKKHKSFWKLQ